ncbi:MAG: hypothetical protein IK075_03265, partial [Prevotella sp.]|nr:hypothetical protein [Prevotella sp.]
ARYNRVTAITEKPKILFALGIITFIDEANSVLKAYLKDLERHVCRDALALNFKELADKGYWLKDDRLRQEMYAFACKTLSSYGVMFALDGVTFEDTLQIYKVIEEKVEQMVALLKMVEAALRSAPPQLYQNFYDNLRAQYNEEQAKDDFDNWLMHSGKMTIGKLKSLQAQAIANYVNSGTLKCAFKTCGDERSHVDIQEIRNLLPDNFPYKEWFDDCYAVFCRTISWDGYIVVPDYYCAGLFIFQHWDQLTEKDIKAIFYLDKMLEIIHEEMVRLLGRAPALPEALATPKAMILWQKVKEAGYVDKYYQPLLSQTQSAMLAYEMARRLGIREKWKVFEKLWGKNNLRGKYNVALNQRQTLAFQDKLKMLFSE